MASPIVASDFSVVEFSGDLCTQVQQLVAVNNRLKSWFEWAFDEFGEPTSDFIVTLSAVGIPVGGVIFYPVNVTPTGWLLCNGQAVNRVTYASLFARIGTSYGTGDGVNTFNIPDYQGRFLYGSGTTKSTGDTGGSEEVTLAKEEIPEVLDVVWQNPTTDLAVASQTALSGGTTGASPMDIDSDNSQARTSEVELVVGGDGDPHDNMPPFSAGLWLIRY